MNAKNAAGQTNITRQVLVELLVMTALTTSLSLAKTCRASAKATADRIHLVFVVGTYHYSPQISMPRSGERNEAVRLQNDDDPSAR